MPFFNFFFGNVTLGLKEYRYGSAICISGSAFYHCKETRSTLNTHVFMFLLLGQTECINGRNIFCQYQNF